MQMIYILQKNLNLNHLVSTHHSYQRWICVGHTYLQFFLSSNNPSFHETLGSTSKTCPLNVKGQKDVIGEGFFLKGLICVRNRSTEVVFTVHVLK